MSSSTPPPPSNTSPHQQQPVLIISDDDPLVARALARAAQRAGMLVICDLSSQVERLALRYKPAIILMDIHQHVNGMQLLERLKKNPETANIKVVMMSGVPTAVESV